jgi:hypothetical protein
MATLLTTQQLKDVYLSGVKLADQSGQPLPTALFDSAITAAVSWFELKTKIHTTPVDITDEQHDFNADTYNQFCWIHAYEYPILEVTSVTAQYPTGQTIIVFPSTWVKARFKSGQIQLVPTAGSLSQVLIGQGGNYLPLLSGRISTLPDLFLVNYKAGFDNGKIPDAVNDAIGLRAAIHVMSTAGSIVLGVPGLQTQSIGVDGLSQSVSAMVGQFGPYSGRINEYNKRLEDLMETLVQEYKGIRMVVL